MKKTATRLLAALMLVCSLFFVSATAFADAVLDFEVTQVGYEDGVLKAAGTFTNSGDKAIEKVNKVDVKIYLYNEDGDSVLAANHYFEDLPLTLAPGESMEYVLEFPGVPEYTDATEWLAEEGDWEFTYIEDEEADVAADEAEEAAAELEEAVAEFEQALDEALAEIEEAIDAAETEAELEQALADLEEVIDAAEEVAAALDEVALAAEEDEAEEGESALDFQVTSVSYEEGKLTAVGKFVNIGAKNIESVESVNVKITLFNDDGDSVQAADHVFTGLLLHIAPGEEVEYTLVFDDVPEYTDATEYSAEEVEWTFTYFE